MKPPSWEATEAAKTGAVTGLAAVLLSGGVVLIWWLMSAFPEDYSPWWVVVLYLAGCALCMGGALGTLFGISETATEIKKWRRTRS